MNKAYIVKKIYKGRLAICCYLEKYQDDYFSWALYCDYNNTEELFDRIRELKRNKYNIEFIEEKKNESICSLSIRLYRK